MDLISSMRAVIRTLIGFGVHWFCSDRIRISPTQGRLLGLSSGDRLVIGNEVYRVSSRSHERQRVLYELHNEDGTCTLRVPIPLTDDFNGKGSDAVHLRGQGFVQCLFENEIMILRRDVRQE